VAMVDPTPAALGALVADDLSYGHSSGKVDTKASFIGDLVAGKSDFVSITITDQTIKVAGDVAIVRHTLAADTNDSGKPGKVALKILGIWQKQGAEWKMLARQAVRI
ncbi:MAG TPA: nuclear transport factor 2 family protein, partial [Variovorax sp.]|nr:nuclear transport factor 2 family protein [Variovorax sp.]